MTSTPLAGRCSLNTHMGGGVRNLCLYLLSLLEPSRWDGVALLVLQQLLRRLEELVADVALKHPSDEMDLEVALVHAVRLAHEVAEDALKSCREMDGWIDRERERGRDTVPVEWFLLSRSPGSENKY